jgi:hypothetical protein
MRRRIRRRTLRRLYRIVSRIYRLFNEDGWRVRYARITWNRPLCEEHGVDLDSVGFCDYENDEIWVDYRADVLATIVHECLHAIYPDMPEYEVRQLEKMVMDNLSPVQAKRILRHTGYFLC